MCVCVLFVGADVSEMLTALHQYVRQRPCIESALSKLVRGLGALERRLDAIQAEFEQLLVDDAHSEFPVFGHLLALDAAAAGSTAPPTAPWTARDDACLARFLDANQVNLLLIDRSLITYKFRSHCALSVMLSKLEHIAQCFSLFIAQDGQAQNIYCGPREVRRIRTRR